MSAHRDLTTIDLDAPDPSLEAAFLEDQAVADFEERGLIPKWELRKLTPRHKQICALVAQGFKYVEIAPIVQCTPQYITMLMRQALIVEEVHRLEAIAGTRLLALTDQAVDVTAETLRQGSEKGKLVAARMVLEAGGRLGRRDAAGGQATSDAEERLRQLAERLEKLNSNRPRRTYNEDGEDVTDVATG